MPILRVLRVAALIDERMTGALSALHGVSLREVMLMIYVRNSPSSKLSRVELARQLCVSPATVTRATRPLEKIGLLDREADPRDARLSYVVLTDAGNELLDNAELSLEQLSANFLSQVLSDSDTNRLTQLLGKLDALNGAAFLHGE